ncbi:HET-domain-containing protein [Didymella exigua CBS 183.55]|uniref:HET-domain-containing protein n=1 Tax=Didymella exigua CBS 183.55 TaxID=1150837 RepID=A0A6A5RRL2_9PLEO|nr:HET-domain-containing protein [Didymella exigua CBS 183.55]KAF1931071.1 HET-domain-containing protein [Didymella exigua CBS 183.55]
MTTRVKAFSGQEDKAGNWDDRAPFVPDKLCQQCTHIFENPGKRNINVLYIHPAGVRECRICVLLTQHYTDYLDSPSEQMKVGYFIADRCNSPGLYDLMFRLCGVYYGTAPDLRFGIQARDRADVGFEHEMVPFSQTIAQSTASEQTLAQARCWLDKCVETHLECRAVSNDSKFVPSRLIEISGVDETCLKVRLREGKNVPSFFEYATLSHRWGESMPFKLTRDNLEECFNELLMSRLSLVFQEALKFAWRMKIYYVWIDSLCIIQDSHEDWVAESSQMGPTYKGGVLNIAAAAGSENTTTGLLGEREARLIAPIAVSVSSAIFMSFDPRCAQNQFGRGDYYLIDMLTWAYGIDQSPLCGRGWIAQERALSVRTIYFGKQQLYWDCASPGSKATEVYPEGLLQGTLFYSPKYVLRYGLDVAYRRTGALRLVRDLVQISEYDNVAKCHTEKQRITERKQTLRLELDQWIELCGPASDTFEERTLGTSTEGMLTLNSVHLKDCDFNVLNAFGLTNWGDMKRALRVWGIGAPTGRPTTRVSTEVRQWMQIVEYYSRCSLTFSSDKLVAISGIAELFGKTIRCAYLSGLWERDLRHQLLWKTWPRCASPLNDGTRGPSWSWTAIDSYIHFTSRKSHLTDT